MKRLLVVLLACLTGCCAAPQQGAERVEGVAAASREMRMLLVNVPVSDGHADVPTGTALAFGGGNVRGENSEDATP